MNQDVLKAKEAVVEEVAENMRGAESVTIVEYRGLTVEQITTIRRELMKQDATMRIYKNSLVERAAEKLGYKGLEETLSGPNAVVCSKGAIEGPKTLAKFAKKYQHLVIKGGVVEGRVMSADEMKVIATLPGRDGLISMFLSCLQAPVRQFACAIQAVADKQN